MGFAQNKASGTDMASVLAGKNGTRATAPVASATLGAQGVSSSAPNSLNSLIDTLTGAGLTFAGKGNAVTTQNGNTSTSVMPLTFSRTYRGTPTIRQVTGGGANGQTMVANPVTGVPTPMFNYTGSANLSAAPTSNWAPPSATALRGMTTYGDSLSGSTSAPAAGGKATGGRIGFESGGAPRFDPLLPSPDDLLRGLMFGQTEAPESPSTEAPRGIAGVPPGASDALIGGLQNLFSRSQGPTPEERNSAVDPLRAQVTPDWLAQNPRPATVAATDAANMGGFSPGLLNGPSLDVPSNLVPQVRETPYSALTDPDKLARIILSEAASNDPREMAAIGASVINRAAQGMGGDNIAEVVQKPFQFEPMSDPDSVMARDQDPRYAQALAVANGLLTGELSDPTAGATHFFAEDTQRALGRQAPEWAAGQTGERIGDHTFFRGIPGVGGWGDDETPSRSIGAPPPVLAAATDAAPPETVIGAPSGRGMEPGQTYQRVREESWTDSPWLALAAGLLSSLSSGSVGKGGLTGLQFLLQQRAAQGQRDQAEEEARLAQYQADTSRMGAETSRMTAEANAANLIEEARIARERLGVEREKLTNTGTKPPETLPAGLVGPNGFALQRMPDGSVVEIPGVRPARSAAASMGDMPPHVYKDYSNTVNGLNSNNDAIRSLETARSLIPNMYNGALADTRATVASQWGDEQAVNTLEYQRILRDAVSATLREKFGAAPTEGERKYLDSIQAMANTTTGEKEAALDRALRVLENIRARTEYKARSITEGTYQTPQYLQGLQDLEAKANADLAEATAGSGAPASERIGAPGYASPEDMLRANPQLRGAYDEKYGPGAAAKVLGN